MLAEPPGDPAEPQPLHARLDRRGVSLIAVLGLLTGLLWGGGTAAAQPATAAAPASAPAAPAAPAAPTAKVPARPAQGVAPAKSTAKPAHPSVLPLSASALLAGVQPQGTVVSDMVAASETTALAPAPADPTSSMVPATQFRPRSIPPPGPRRPPPARSCRAAPPTATPSTTTTGR